MSSIKHRHLGVKSSHRSALLRNLVTSLIETESIRTTWPRAKEAQRMAEKLITLGKRNTNAARQRAQGILFVCQFTNHSTSQAGLSLPFPLPSCSFSSHNPKFRLILTPLVPIWIETRRIPPKTLRPPPRALRQPTGRLHARPAHRTPKSRQQAQAR